MRRIDLPKLLSDRDGAAARQLGLFGLVKLAGVKMLANKILSATEATWVFFHAQNCLYVRKELRE
jgi:hypothetical protein